MSVEGCELRRMRSPGGGDGSVSRVGACLVLATLGQLTIGGCSSSRFEWQVTLSTATHQVCPPHEPAWARREPERDSPRRVLQPPLHWRLVQDDQERPFRYGTGLGTVSARSVVTDGVDIARRSSAIASVTKKNKGKRLLLNARTLRGCFSHQVGAEGVAKLAFELPRGCRLRLLCAAHSSSDADVRLLPEDPTRAEHEAASPDDVSRAYLVIEVAPQLEDLLVFADEVEEAYGKDNRAIILSYSPTGLFDVGSHKPVQYYVRGRGVKPFVIPAGHELCIDICNGSARDEQSGVLIGGITFKVFSSNDWDSEHRLFATSLSFASQREVWDAWAESWGGGPRGTPIKNQSLAIDIRMSGGTAFVPLVEYRNEEKLHKNSMW